MQQPSWAAYLSFPEQLLRQLSQDQSQALQLELDPNGTPIALHFPPFRHQLHTAKTLEPNMALAHNTLNPHQHTLTTIHHKIRVLPAIERGSNLKKPKERPESILLNHQHQQIPNKSNTPRDHARNKLKSQHENFSKKSDVQDERFPSKFKANIARISKMAASPSKAQRKRCLELQTNERKRRVLSSTCASTPTCLAATLSVPTTTFSESSDGGGIGREEKVRDSSDTTEDRKNADLAVITEGCVHILALGPSKLVNLEKTLRPILEKIRVKLSRPMLRKALENVSESPRKGVYSLSEEYKHQASTSWPHYTPAQKNTLQAIQIWPVADPFESTVPTIEYKPRCIDSMESYAEAKKEFENLYAKYLNLDQALSGHTVHFDSLERECLSSSQTEREAAKQSLIREFQARRSTIERQAQTYRVLHLKLRRIQQGVNRFVDDFTI